MQKVSEFISTIRNSKYLGLIAILVLVAIIPLTVLIAQMNQDIRQRASELSISPISPVSPPAPTTVVSVSIFRLFNSRNGDRLYTANPQERDSAVKIGYRFEGVGFYAPINTTTGYVPVYRFYRSKTGEHFYTADQNEADTIKKYGYTYGYTQEGIAFYASVSAGTGLTPVYRFINRSTGFHFYTASESEKNNLNSSSYILEGIAFYTPITTSATPIPVAGTPQITGITVTNRIVTITGQNFINLPQFPAGSQYVSVRDGKGGVMNMGSPTAGGVWNNTQIRFTLPSSFPFQTGYMLVYANNQWSNQFPFSMSVAASKRVFVTNSTFNGDLKSAGSKFGLGVATSGLDGADKICQGSANVARLGGVWKAWISDNTTSAANRLTHNNGPYTLLNGVAIANNWADLIDGTLQNPFRITELGTEFRGNTWTNTNIDGTVKNSNDNTTCGSWTTSYENWQGLLGFSDSRDSSWTATRGWSCKTSFRLYCFEQ